MNANKFSKEKGKIWASVREKYIYIYAPMRNVLNEKRMFK